MPSNPGLNTLTTTLPTIAASLGDIGPVYGPLIPAGYLATNPQSFSHLSGDTRYWNSFTASTSGGFVDVLAIAGILGRAPRFIIDGSQPSDFAITGIRVAMWDSCVGVAQNDWATLQNRSVALYSATGNLGGWNAMAPIPISVRFIMTEGFLPLTSSTKVGNVYIGF